MGTVLTYHPSRVIYDVLDLELVPRGNVVALAPYAIPCVLSTERDHADRIHKSLLPSSRTRSNKNTRGLGGHATMTVSRGRIARSPNVGSEARIGRGGAGGPDGQGADGAVVAGGEIGHDWGEDAEGEGLGAAGCLIGTEGEGDFVELGE